jgi:hypothetical protein
MGVGMPHSLKLQEFGRHLESVFGTCVYHVGSSLMQKTGWRDVDVRVILEDEVWDQMGLGDPNKTHRNYKWVALCLAFSALGKEITGLPIDFQIQRGTEANNEYVGGRSYLGGRSYIGEEQPRAETILPGAFHKVPTVLEADRISVNAEAIQRGTINADWHDKTSFTKNPFFQAGPPGDRRHIRLSGSGTRSGTRT